MNEAVATKFLYNLCDKMRLYNATFMMFGFLPRVGEEQLQAAERTIGDTVAQDFGGIVADHT